MSDITSLSKEVLINILLRVGSLRDLAQCRLVCTDWDHLAEKAMFCGSIPIKSDAQALVLYAHLFKSPSLRKLIRHIHFCPDYKNKSKEILTALMKLALTPNIERITGIASENYFYPMVEDIMDQSVVPFSKLRRISNNFVGFSEGYCSLSLKLKQSLASLAIFNIHHYPSDRLWCFLDQLDEFKRLREVEFALLLNQIPDVERVLKGCRHATALRSQFKFREPLMDTQVLASWMETNVEKVMTLTSMTVFISYRGDYFEYLVFKYPNLKTLEIKPQPHSTFPITNMINFQENMDRILTAIKDVPVKKFRMKVNHGSNFLDICKYFSSKKCKTVVEKTIGDNTFLLSIEGM